MVEIQAKPSAGGSCPLCMDELEGDLPRYECPGCTTGYHEDCAIEMGGCSTVGCSERGKRPDITPRRRSPEEVEETRRSVEVARERRGVEGGLDLGVVHQRARPRPNVLKGVVSVFAVAILISAGAGLWLWVDEFNAAQPAERKAQELKRRPYEPPMLEQGLWKAPTETNAERIQVSFKIRRGLSPFELKLRSGSFEVTRVLTEGQRDITLLTPLEIGDNAIDAQVTDARDRRSTLQISVRRSVARH